MAGILFKLTLVFFLSLFAFTAQTTGIYISTSSSAGGDTASSWESFSLDASTSLSERQVLSQGSISTNRQTEGKGNNSLKQTLSGSGYVIGNDIEIQGEFSASTDSSASARTAALNQNVRGNGDLSLELLGREGTKDAVQQAKVEGGLLNSQHSLSAGEGITASQNTLIEGQKGSILAGALSKDNVMVARGDFNGQGSMLALLESTTKNRASATGTAYIDGAQVLNDKTFKAVKANGLSQGMGVSGLRMVEGGLGDFDVSVVNLDWAAGDGSTYASEKEVDESRGSSSSYALTGYRWNQKNPNIQLYLNSKDVPSGIKAESAQNAITDAADAWDEAVEQSLFTDDSTVIIDDSKKVINPFSEEYAPDGFNLNGFMNLGNDYLSLTAFWTDLSEKDGYYSIIESDIVYNLDFKWTDDEKQAENTGKLDLQSVALHELGHTIGLGDLYNLNDGDERKLDYAQVMNLYDGPQRTLGNGDLAGAQEMYGVPDSRSLLQSRIGVLRDGAWYLDYNGNGDWDQGDGDVLNFFGTSGDLPAIGDWNGDGRNKIGVLRNGAWYLDYNGNGIWDQGNGDVLNFFGTSGDLPVTGDWNADGKDDMGVLRSGEWYLDYNGNGIWDAEDIVSSSFALPGDLPIIGDWSGDGKDKIGVLRSGEWYLDYNGNGIWDAEDIFSNSFGINGDLPVAGDWNGDGKDKIGVLRNGEWYFDYNGNGIWDSGDIVSFFGTEGDRPVAKYWT